jgi:GT2 family glycosyltransferase
MISISVITYNSENWIEPFFDSLLKQDFPPDRMVVFVTDNGSSDSTLQKLRSVQMCGKFSRFSISLSTNSGFGSAHNNNFRQVTTPFCLAANIDLTFEPSTIFSLLETASRDLEEVASWEARQKPYEHPKVYDPIALTTSWSSSACTLFRVSAFNDVGGYDDVFFMYGEDVDLSWRLRAKGYILKYCPNAVCWHYTYSESKFKKIQFLGSLLGNLYLRARYGDADSVETGEFNYRQVVESAAPNYPEQSEDLSRNFQVYLSNKPHFLSGSPEERSRYASVGKFVGDWDYEIVRDGAYVEIGLPPADSPLVSIIVRTYAHREFLLKQNLCSILNQTYDNFEVLVVEDGGASTAQVVSEFNSSRLRHIACEKLGRCHTGNIGLSNAVGQYLMFLDDDDFLYCDHLESLIHALSQHSNSKAAYSNAFELKSTLVRNPEGVVVGANSTQPPKIFDLVFSHTEMLFRNLMPIQAVLFHRSLYESAGGFEVHLDNLEDWNLWTKFSALTSFFYLKKTTSVFRTPDDHLLSDRRVQEMHAFYAAAISFQKSIYLTGVPAHAIREEVDAYKKDAQRLNDDIRNLREHIDHIGSMSRDLSIERDELKAAMLGLSAHNHSLVNALNSITKSKLWRLTRLARRILRYFR